MTLDQAMHIAIEEALKGAPYVSPNPKVGSAVLDRNGNLISKGYHTKYGQPHAEVEAVKGLTNTQLEGAHVIVTLEPCAHEGKTPSCAKMLAKLPIKKVTYGLIDPNPLVAGQGAEILRKAGIETEEYQGPYKPDLEEVCEEFLWNFRQKKVFVAMKVAQSLDGKIALKSGESKWITGSESRVKVHALRAQYDALLVGKNTVLFDNPSLDVRHPSITKENKVVILDRSGEIAKRKENLKVFSVHKSENIHLYAKENLDEVLKDLYAKGIRSLMIEGGSKIYSAFLKENFVQRIHLFTAPLILGEGISWSEDFKIESLQKRKELSSMKTQLFGRDQYLTARF